MDQSGQIWSGSPTPGASAPLEIPGRRRTLDRRPPTRSLQSELPLELARQVGFSTCPGTPRLRALPDEVSAAMPTLDTQHRLRISRLAIALDWPVPATISTRLVTDGYCLRLSDNDRRGMVVDRWGRIRLVPGIVRRLGLTPGRGVLLLANTRTRRMLIAAEPVWLTKLVTRWEADGNV